MRDARVGQKRLHNESTIIQFTKYSNPPGSNPDPIIVQNIPGSTSRAAMQNRFRLRRTAIASFEPKLCKQLFRLYASQRVRQANPFHQRC